MIVGQEFRCDFCGKKSVCRLLVAGINRNGEEVKVPRELCSDCFKDIPYQEMVNGPEDERVTDD